MPRVYKNPCTIDGCPNRAVARGWCHNHYGRWRRNKHPTAGRDGPGKIDSYVDELLAMPRCDECIEWPYSKDMDGRGKVTRATGDGSCTTIMAARYILEKICDPPTDKHQALHDCGKGHEGCVNPSHLYWGTSSQNALDKRRHGTVIRGEQSHKAKLNSDQVFEIRALRASKKPNELAEIFGISRSGIRAILTGKSWAHILPTPFQTPEESREKK